MLKKKKLLLLFLLNIFYINPASISYLILSHNETESLEELLKFLHKNKQNEDEIVVIDDFSSNSRTLEILEKANKNYNVKIFQRALNYDFSGQRNYGNSVCSKEYIFCIDADQIPSLFLMQNIKKIIKSNADAYRIPALIIINGLFDADKRLNNRGWIWPCYKIVLFKNNKLLKWNRPVHEVINEKILKKIEDVPCLEKFALIEQKTYKKTSNSFYFYLNCYKQWIIDSIKSKEFNNIEIALSEFRNITNNGPDFFNLLQDDQILTLLDKQNLYTVLRCISPEIHSRKSLAVFIENQKNKIDSSKIDINELFKKHERSINVSTDKNGTTLLMHAAYNNLISITKYLLNKGADASIKDINGYTALDHAKFKENDEIINILFKPTVEAELKKANLSLKDNINQQDNNGRTLLIKAAIKNNLYLVKLLIGCNADPLIKDKNGKLALDHAHKNAELSEFLLSKTLEATLKKANIKFNGFVNYSMDDKNQTLLSYACKTNNLLLAKLLVDYGADSTIIDDQNKTAFDYANHFYKKENRKEYKEMHELIRINHLKHLIENNKKLKNYINKHKLTVNNLLKNINQYIDKKNKTTLLMHAKKLGYSKIVTLLSNYGSNSISKERKSL